MRTIKVHVCCVAALMSIFWVAASAFAAEPAKTDTVILKPGSTIAIVGESATAQMRYSRYLEAYLLACGPDLKLKVIQFGREGESAPGFLARMDADVMLFNPDYVTICYGMQDGRGAPYNDSIGKTYESALRSIVQKLKDKGSTAIVATPGCVDSEIFKDKSYYNETLKMLGEIARKIAADYSMPVAEVHSVMAEAMKKAKAACGNTYYMTGPEGSYPARNGHLTMAYALLKAMGFDGNIGTLTVDFEGKAEGDKSHTITSFRDGRLEVESSRYPFCFMDQTTTPGGTKGILPFLPFNQDLNRFTLIVKHLPAAKAEIQWGTEKKIFDKAQLETGINLAAEFLDNPFVPRFSALLNLLEVKQTYESQLARGLLPNLPLIVKEDKNDAATVELVEAFKKKLMDIERISQAKAAASIVPIKHRIDITPIK